MEYCSKIDLEKIQTSKKLKKLDKMAQKLSEAMLASKECYDLDSED